MIPQHILAALAQRKTQGGYRKVLSSYDGIDFHSNDYLGLSQNKELLSLIQSSTEKTHFLGATGSRLISGNRLYDEVESELCAQYQSESGLLFPSGYMANLAVFSSIPQRADTVLYDEYIHASIRDGIRLGVAKNYSFLHNDYTHLEHLLQKAQGEIFVVTEGIFSMDGDSPNAYSLSELQHRYGFHLIVDEAHSTGVLGKNGTGWHETYSGTIFLRIHTFGKAMGYHGAFVACAKAVREYLINFARPLIYTTGMDAHSLVTIKEIHQYFRLHQEKLLESLRENLSHLQHIPYLQTYSHSPIALYVTENANFQQQQFQEKKLLISYIQHPTVPKGEERFRICMHNFNTLQEIEILKQCLI